MLIEPKHVIQLENRNFKHKKNSRWPLQNLKNQIFQNLKILNLAAQEGLIGFNRP